MTPGHSEMEISDAELVQLARAGSMAAFDGLVRRYRGAVSLVAAQESGCSARAEDIAQEVFVQAYRALGQLGDDERFAAWLYAIARRRARRATGMEDRRACAVPDGLERQPAAPDTDPQWLAVRDAERSVVHAALDAVEPAYRTVLVLHYLEQWPVARIAEFLSLTATTVKWRLHQGRKRLREQLLTRMDEQMEERDHER